VAADAGKIKNMELTEILNYIFGVTSLVAIVATPYPKNASPFPGGAFFDFHVSYQCFRLFLPL
jgi:hypothetical protein